MSLPIRKSSAAPFITASVILSTASQFTSRDLRVCKRGRVTTRPNEHEQHPRQKLSSRREDSRPRFAVVGGQFAVAEIAQHLAHNLHERAKAGHRE